MDTKFMRRVIRWATAFLPALMLSGNATAATPPSTPSTPVVGDYVIKGFTFTSGETLPELRIHYLTFGKPVKDARGMVRNAVLIGHGTGGSADGFLRPQFAGELFGPGQPLDVTKYYIVMSDGIGHGKSSKPSDGLHAHFPH